MAKAVSFATQMRRTLDSPATPPLKFGPWPAKFAAAESYAGVDATDLADDEISFNLRGGDGRAPVIDLSIVAGIYTRVYNTYWATGAARLRIELMIDMMDGSQIAVIASEPVPRASPGAPARRAPLVACWHKFLTAANRAAVHDGGMLTVELRRDAGRLVLAVEAEAAIGRTIDDMPSMPSMLSMPSMPSMPSPPSPPSLKFVIDADDV
jgi:hypothetical protein